MARRLIDSNTRREVRRQGALLDKLTAQFRGRLQREIATAMREMVEHWEQAKARGLKLETKESFAQIMTRRALRFIEQEAIRRRITEVTETTRDQIIRAVRKGYEDGLGQRGTASYILDLVPQISSYRAEMIARTETHGAANYGSQEAAKQTGLPLSREWLAAADDRTRETHREANGQVVGMDEKFKVGDAELMFPGDPEGPGEEVINCRCAVGYIVDEAALEAML
jgi:SPP1 gp7 family putative phage head morphogenesis protein